MGGKKSCSYKGGMKKHHMKMGGKKPCSYKGGKSRKKHPKKPLTLYERLFGKTIHSKKPHKK